MTSRLTIGLAVVVMLLVGVIVYQDVAPVAPVVEPALAARPVTGTIAKLPAFTPQPLEQFSVISARAPFDPARQPVPEPTVAAATANTASPPPVTLVGVVVSESNAVALLLKANGQTVSARVGQSVDGWQLVRVAPGRAVFRAGTTDYTVTLRAAAGLAQPPLNNSSPPPSTEKPGQ